MSELKRCPFCGGEARLQHRQRKRGYYVICKECGCRTPLFQYQYDSLEKLREQAIEAWNTRKPMDDIVERLEELYKFNNAKKKEAYDDRDWVEFDIYSNMNVGIYQAIAIVKGEV